MTIVIYTRLSLEDGTNQESASIVNQRHLLLDFIRNHPDLYGAKVVEFSDDGYSGKNFDRPGVQSLLQAARFFNVVPTAVAEMLSTISNSTSRSAISCSVHQDRPSGASVQAMAII